MKSPRIQRVRIGRPLIRIARRVMPAALDSVEDFEHPGKEIPVSSQDPTNPGFGCDGRWSFRALGVWEQQSWLGILTSEDKGIRFPAEDIRRGREAFAWIMHRDSHRATRGWGLQGRCLVFHLRNRGFAKQAIASRNGN
jgi:hypothetical protein